MNSINYYVSYAMQDGQPAKIELGTTWRIPLKYTDNEGVTYEVFDTMRKVLKRRNELRETNNGY